MQNRNAKSERDCLKAFNPPVRIERPDSLGAPIVLASPHSGRLYPKAFRKMSQQKLATLRMNEDAYIDQLFSIAPPLGLPLQCARFPRCFVDVNRDEKELPASLAKNPSQLSLHAQMGLGVIPTHIAETLPIYDKALKLSAVEARLTHLYRPYHASLSGLLDDSLARFGRVLLLDCHSMPGYTALGQKRPDIVLGNCHGQSCRPETIARIERLFQKHGLSVQRNFPYAGGYVTRHYAKPDQHVEVLQIEISRALYMSARSLKPSRRFEALRRTMGEILNELVTASDLKELAAE